MVLEVGGEDAGAVPDVVALLWGGRQLGFGGVGNELLGM